VVRKSGRRFAESEGDEEEGGWLASYSDLITDLLAIFVVLFAFAMMTQAIAESKAAHRESVSELMDSKMQSFMDAQNGFLPDKDSINSLIESMKSYIDEEELSEQLSVIKQNDNQIVIRVAVSVLFDSGRADINSNAEELLGSISEILSGYADSIKMVRIEGHTDDRPIKTKLFDSNWELSTSRAVNILRRLLEISPLGPEKFSAVGYGEFHPIAENDTAANRAQNRRVDFVVETVSDKATNP
jgi:chemotaxis protein MotB